MKLNEILANEIDTIQPADLEAVLRSLGWRTEGGIPNLASQWLKPDDPAEPSLLVPLNNRLADYRTRLWEALLEVERIHGDQGDMIITNLLLPGLDEVTNEKKESTIAGSIPWTVGEKQIIGFREMLTASAKAAEVKERYYGRKRWSIASRFLSQVRMGQTKIGSYVITALSPVGSIPVVDQKGQYDENLGITGRQVIETLAKSLDTLRESATEYKTHGDGAVFDEAITYGVSLDLVKAVHKNLGLSEAALTSVQWTSRITAPNIKTEIVFDQTYTAPLVSAITRLTEVVQSKRAVITGRVTGLNRDAPGNRGVVVLNVLDGPDDVEYVSLVLGEAYDEAIEFHRAGTLVRAEGELNREGRNWELTDVTSLELLTSQEIGALRLAIENSLAADNPEDGPNSGQTSPGAGRTGPTGEPEAGQTAESEEPPF